MPSPWHPRVVRAKKLNVFNDAGIWAVHVKKAFTDFNGLGFPVTLAWAEDKVKADVVVRLSNGNDTEFGWAKSNFNAASTHGQTISDVDDRNRVSKSVVFLPAKLARVSNDIKVLVVVHELIHASGLIEKNDHDPGGGIMAAKFQLISGKLREASEDRNLRGMPPIRVGGWTRCTLNPLWGGECEEDD